MKKIGKVEAHNMYNRRFCKSALLFVLKNITKGKLVLTKEQKNEWLNKNILGEPSSLRDFYYDDEDQQAINFFRLWRVIKEKEWFKDFFWNVLHNSVDDFKYNEILCGFKQKVIIGKTYVFKEQMINCSTLADAVGEYFKWDEVPKCLIQHK